MVTIIDERERLSVPSWVTDLEGFRRLTDAEDFPDEYRIWWLRGEVCADVSGNADGLFLSSATLASDRVRLIEGKDGGFVELQGSPDMVLEIVSTGSEHKDNVILKQAYHEAGIREYWLVDARAEPIVFDVFRHTARGYVRSSKREEWVKSAVFCKAFRLNSRVGAQGHPDYTLEVR